MEYEISKHVFDADGSVLDGSVRRESSNDGDVPGQFSIDTAREVREMQDRKDRRRGMRYRAVLRRTDTDDIISEVNCRLG